VTRNQLPAHVTGYGINRGRWLDQPDAEHEIEEVDGLPLPAWADCEASFSVEREKEKAK